MGKPTKKELGTGAFVFVMVFLAWISRLPGCFLNDASEVIRGVIYPALYIFWGMSLYFRLVQPQVRRYMVTISGLMVLWFLFRTIKFSFTEGLPALSRYLWYLYYLPMLFIPLLAVLVAFSIGLPEEKPLPGKTALLFIPASLLLVLVLTNDLHQLVFTFPVDAAVRTDDNYGYAFGYGLIVAYLLACALTLLAALAVKCRLTGSRGRILLPCLPILVLLFYTALYFLRVDWLYTVAGDMTAVMCLLYAATLELCIRRSLIPTNTGYAALFAVSSLGARIVNRENTVCLQSANAIALTKEQIAEAEAGPIQADKNTRIKSHGIRFGHVLWQEDVAGLAEAIEQIEENCRDLEECNRIQREHLEARKKILVLQEKNRASDLLHRETAPQIDRIDRMLTQADGETDENKRRGLLAGVAVIGAYIKRYGNLLLMGEHAGTADIHDLARCFEESLTNLELLGIQCQLTLPSGFLLGTKDMLRVYRTFETIVEACLYDLRCVWIHARETGETVTLSMEFVCDTGLSELTIDTDGVCCEDGTWRFTFRLRKGGGKNEAG